MNDLLDIIAGQEQAGFFELRFALPRGGMGQDFYPLKSRGAVKAAVAQRAPHTDVFIGAAPRARREGGKAACERIWCLWADADTPEAVERLYEFDPMPTMVIRSGSGGNLHAWWRLSHPLTAMWAERANRSLAHHLRADMKATDAARIMRPPGSLNHKHDPPSPVVVFGRADVTYAVSDVVGNLKDPKPERPKPAAPRPVTSADDLERIPAAEYVRALTGQEPDLRGMVRCVIHREGGESNPSMKCYDTTYYCFGCGDGGDIYQLASRLWNMDRRAQFPALRKRLSDALGVAA